MSPERISREQWPREVECREPLADVGEVNVEVPFGEPPGEPGLDCVGPAGGRGDVIREIVEPADRAVIGDPPGIVAEHAVANPARLQVVEPVRVKQVEEPVGLGAAHDQLSQGGDVDQAGAVVHGHRLPTGIAVVIGTAPVARPEHVAAELAMPPVDRGALRGLEGPARQHAHRHGRPGRPGGGQPDLLDRLVVVVGHLADRGELAHPPLAGTHRHRRVALQQLQRVEALVDREVDVVGGDVLAEAGEALAVPAAGPRGRGGLRPDAIASASLERLSGLGESGALLIVTEAHGHRRLGSRQQPRRLRVGVTCHRAGRVDVRRRLAGNVSPALGIPFRLGTGLQEQRARRDAAPGDGQQVAVETAFGLEVGLPVIPQFGDHRALDPLAAIGLDHHGAGQQRDVLRCQAGRELVIRPTGTGVSHRRHRDSGVAQGEGGLESAVGGRCDHRAPTRPDPIQRRESLRAGAEHHPWQVVALEHQGLLD